MKRTVILILSLLYTIDTSCQDIFIDQQRKDIVNHMSDEFYTSTYVTIDNTDTLAFALFTESYPLEYYCIFDSLKVCRQQIIKIYCSKCAKHYLESILKWRKYKFKQLSKNYYYSKRSKNILMRVIEDDEYEICVKILLDHINWSKDEYKKFEKRGKEYKKSIQ